MNKLQE